MYSTVNSSPIRIPGFSVPSRKSNLTPRAQHPDREHQRRAGGADRRLHDRRHVRQRELDRHLVEAPAQAQDHRQRDRQQIERARAASGVGPGAAITSSGVVSIAACAIRWVRRHGIADPRAGADLQLPVLDRRRRDVEPAREVVEPRGVRRCATCRSDPADSRAASPDSRASRAPPPARPPSWASGTR